MKKVSRHVSVSTGIQSLILRQALFGARIEAQYHSLFQNTLGIIFLGTPHRGSEIASYGNILANIAAAVMRKPSSRLTDALQTNSPELLQLTSEFRHQLPNYQVVSFYERKPTKPFPSLVSQVSADGRPSTNSLAQSRSSRNTPHSWKSKGKTRYR